uniref:Cation-transporting P-type ATPase N-terminal domain-containing protein n=1 Tax=Aegilops tauschii subsp. strangulata TaxID=200361 RepID=A0A453HAU1_AEGTS
LPSAPASSHPPAPPAMEDAYAKSVAEVLQAFGVDRTKGLSDSQVRG